MIYDLENWKLQYVRSLTVYRSKDNTRKDNENAKKIGKLATEQVGVKFRPCFWETLKKLTYCTLVQILKEDMVANIKGEKSVTRELDVEIQRLERQIAQQVNDPYLTAINRMPNI